MTEFESWVDDFIGKVKAAASERGLFYAEQRGDNKSGKKLVFQISQFDDAFVFNMIPEPTKNRILIRYGVEIQKWPNLPVSHQDSWQVKDSVKARAKDRHVAIPIGSDAEDTIVIVGKVHQKLRQ